MLVESIVRHATAFGDVSGPTNRLSWRILTRIAASAASDDEFLSQPGLVFAQTRDYTARFAENCSRKAGATANSPTNREGHSKWNSADESSDFHYSIILSL